MLEEMLEGELVYSRDDGDSDYIYGQPELSTLAGRAYHKRRTTCQSLRGHMKNCVTVR